MMNTYHARKSPGPGSADQTNLAEIVDVLANTRTDALTDAAEPEVYFSFWQMGAFSKHLVLRTETEPRSLATVVQKELRAIDPTVSVENVKTLEDIRADSVASRTFAMNLLMGFALAASPLAIVGIYGVLSLAVGSQRTRSRSAWHWERSERTCCACCWETASASLPLASGLASSLR